MVPWDNQRAVTDILRRMISSNETSFTLAVDLPPKPDDGGKNDKPMAATIIAVLTYILVMSALLYGGMLAWQKYVKPRLPISRGRRNGDIELYIVVGLSLWITLMTRLLKLPPAPSSTTLKRFLATRVATIMTQMMRRCHILKTLTWRWGLSCPLARILWRMAAGRIGRNDCEGSSLIHRGTTYLLYIHLHSSQDAHVNALYHEFT